MTTKYKQGDRVKASDGFISGDAYVEGAAQSLTSDTVYYTIRFIEDGEVFVATEDELQPSFEKECSTCGAPATMLWGALDKDGLICSIMGRGHFSPSCDDCGGETTEPGLAVVTLHLDGSPKVDCGRCGEPIGELDETCHRSCA